MKLFALNYISDVSAGSFGVGLRAAPFPQRSFHLLTSSSRPRAYPPGKLPLRCLCGAESALTYEPPSAPTKRRHQNHLASSPQNSRTLQSAPRAGVQADLDFQIHIFQKLILMHRDSDMLQKRVQIQVQLMFYLLVEVVHKLQLLNSPSILL